MAGAFLAAKTVIWTPPHAERVIHDKVARALAEQKQPLECPLPDVLADIAALPPHTAWSRISAKERLGLFAALMQFTMYLPTIQPYFRADYTQIEALYTKVTQHGAATPVGLHQQLTFALDITGNLPDALWLLLTTCRQYARWYDGEAFVNFQELTKAETQHRMMIWSKSVVAFKPWTPTHPQDQAGDVYYVWTHAIAKAFYGPMSPWWAIDALFYRSALHVGTWLNHSIAHKVSPQSINSDHTIAARYGNAIGKLLAKRGASYN